MREEFWALLCQKALYLGVPLPSIFHRRPIRVPFLLFVRVITSRNLWTNTENDYCWVEKLERGKVQMDVSKKISTYNNQPFDISMWIQLNIIFHKYYMKWRKKREFRSVTITKKYPWHDELFFQNILASTNKNICEVQ